MSTARKKYTKELMTMSSSDLRAFQDRFLPLLDSRMDVWLQQLNTRKTLHDAMAYSVDAGGKRIRPLIIMLVCDAFKRMIDQDVLDVCASLEFVHTYSLIHDDLPAMDNDDLRRGKPTNHIVYGEAMAILAGDGLLTAAFECLNGTDLSDGVKVSLTGRLAYAAGPQGMVNGQTGDIENEGVRLTLPQLQEVHAQKTGALLRYAFEAGGILAGVSGGTMAELAALGESFGLSFQIYDDIMDVVSTPEEMGKATHKDESGHKNTYPGLLGLDGAVSELEKAGKDARECLQVLREEHGADTAGLEELLNYFKVGKEFQ